MMGTRAATFAARVKNLLDFYNRITLNAQPLPSGADITHTLKYFSQVLLGVLKDVPKQPLDLIRNGARDEERLGLYPNMDYVGLYNALCGLSTIVQSVPGDNLMMGESLLNVFASLLPFLETGIIQAMPTAVASMFATFPQALHKDIGDILCYHILPFAMAIYPDRTNPSTYTSPAVLLLLLQYSSNLALHCQAVECLMMLKCDVLRDLLSIVAHGNDIARAAAADLLFFYWPELNLTPADRRSASQKYQGWTVIPCQHINCPHEEAESKHSCFDQGVSIVLGGDSPPPLYICSDCCDTLRSDWPKAVFHDLILPLDSISLVCENPSCKSLDNTAIGLCFSKGCVNANPSMKPVRCCRECHEVRHRNSNHVFVGEITSGWDLSKECQSYLTEAIVSLLIDVSPTLTSADKGKRTRTAVSQDAGYNTLGGEWMEATLSDDERITLYRYGASLLVKLCPPKEEIPDHVIGRLLGLVFHWYESTSLIADPRASNLLEQLKTNFLSEWLQKVAAQRFSLLVHCLLPIPPEWAKVGAHWEALLSNTEHIKSGIARLASLVSYELISFEVWNHIMPYWMEAIRTEISDDEAQDLRGTLVKLLDTEMSPLGFDAYQIYHFVSQRFLNAPVAIQAQALEWLIILTSLGIQIPIFNLLKMFHQGVRSLREDEGFTINRRLSIVGCKPRTEMQFQKNTQLPVRQEGEELGLDSLHSPWGQEYETELTCYIHMLDIINEQLKLSDLKQHQGVDVFPGPQVISLLDLMLQSPWGGEHTCLTPEEEEHRTYLSRMSFGKGTDSEDEEAAEKEDDKAFNCLTCYLEALWHQICHSILEFIIPEVARETTLDEEKLPSEPAKESVSEGSWLAEGLKPSELIVTLADSSLLADSAVPFLPKVQTATEVTISEDVAPMIPQEHVVGAVAKAVTVAEEEGASASCVVVSPTVMGAEQGGQLKPVAENVPLEPGQQFWHTSLGKFKFGLQDLPSQLQLVYYLLNRLPEANDVEVEYHLIKNLKHIVLNAQSLHLAAKEHQGFLIWCQEHLFIRNFWELLDSRYSHVASEVIPILMHCISLPGGSEIMQIVLQEEFLASEWHVRFQALGKATVLGRFLEPCHVKGSPQAQTIVAMAISFAVGCLEDVHHLVATRAALYLDTIKDTSLRVVCWCLEMHFDMVIVDRPMILQTFHQLFNLLSERPILSWDFFLSRFDTLFVESQCQLDSAGDLHIPRDLRQNSIGSKVLQRKLARAQEALNIVTEGRKVPTLSNICGKKWPYKRTMSAPANMTDRLGQERGSCDSRDRSFSRQASAPMMIKRKSSKFWPNLMNVGGSSNCLQGKADELSTAVLLQKSIDLDDFDKETYHLLIFLLMNFMANSKASNIEEKTPQAKLQQMVLQHLYLLLGFIPSEKIFIVPPIKIRFSPIFNAFLSNLPAVLDRNVGLGNILAPTILTVLPFGASPQRSPTERYPPNYSLWLVDPALRHSWLTAALIFFYKYNYKTEPLSSPVQVLVRIVLNTIQAQFHRCHTIPGAMVIAQQNLWTSSVAATEHMQDPSFLQLPVSPPAASPTSKFAGGQSSGGSMIRFGPPTTSGPPTSPLSIFAGKDTDKELSVIPESPKSESPESMIEEQVECLEPLDEQAVEPAQASEIVEAPDSSETDNSTRQRKPSLEIQILSTESSTTESMSTEKDIRIPPPERLLPIGSAETPRVPTPDEVFESPHDTLSPSSVLEMDSENDTTTEGSFKVIPSPIRERLLPVGGSSDLLSESNSPGPSVQATPKIDFFTAGVLVETACQRVQGTQITPPKLEESTVVKENRQTCEDIWEAVTKGTKRPQPSDTVSSPPPPAVESVPEEDDVKREVEFKQLTKTDSQTSSGSKRGVTRQSSLGKWEGSKWTSSTEEKPTRESNQQERRGSRRRFRSTGDDEVFGDALLSPRRRLKAEKEAEETAGDKDSIGILPTRKTAARIGEYGGVVARCTDCGCPLEQYSDEELALCVILLTTFVHREPSLSAQMLPEILNTIASLAWRPLFPWQVDGITYIPGSALSVSRQAIRCILHQMNSNRVFVQIFGTYNSGRRRQQFFRTIVQALSDFTELSVTVPLINALEDLNIRKSLPTENLIVILANITTYYENLPLEAIPQGTASTSSPLTAILGPLETFFRKLLLVLPSIRIIDPILRLMLCAFKTPGVGTCRGIIDPFSKIMTHALEVDKEGINSATLGELLHLAQRAFPRDRDRYYLTRAAIITLTQFLKLKVVPTEKNILLLIQMLLVDAGGYLSTDLKLEINNPLDFVGSAASECMRPHLNDVFEFIQDPHIIFKIKNCLPPDSKYGQKFGGILKASLGQYLALEIVRASHREGKSITRFLPWLGNAPSAVQQSSKEFQECVNHLRLLGWIILATLQHLVIHSITQPFQPLPGQPLPMDCSCHIADHIQLILASYPEQHRTNVLHTNALFNVFVICQLWTVYIEQYPNTGDKDFAINTAALLTDFWAKVTPAILQLVSHSHNLADSVSSQFLNLMESLLECNSTTLSKLLPLWSPILEKQLSGGDMVRLQACQSAVPSTVEIAAENKSMPRLLQWLQHMELKMAQTEFQSSSAEQTINQIRDKGKSMRVRHPLV